MSEIRSRDAVSASPGARAASPAALVRLLRPRQWIKNGLLFAALVFAPKLTDPQAVLSALLAFVAFCLASSSVYVVNDLLDAERDRHHPEKRHRPVAAGHVSGAAAAILAAALTGGAFALAAWIGSSFAVAMLLYVALSHYYSVSGKNVVVLDVMLVAAGFVIRAAAGAIAIDVPFSDWFVLCTFFLALFLALSKRKAELLALGESAGQARPVLRGYTLDSLSAFTATAMAAVLITYALYLHHGWGKGNQLLALTLPFVVFGVFRWHLLVETAGLGEKAEDVVLGDRPILLCVVGFAAVAVVALYG